MSDSQSSEDKKIVVKESSIKKIFDEGVKFDTGVDNILIIERERFKQSF